MGPGLTIAALVERLLGAMLLQGARATEGAHVLLFIDGAAGGGGRRATPRRPWTRATCRSGAGRGKLLSSAPAALDGSARASDGPACEHQFQPVGG